LLASFGSNSRLKAKNTVQHAQIRIIQIAEPLHVLTGKGLAILAAVTNASRKKLLPKTLGSPLVLSFTWLRAWSRSGAAIAAGSVIMLAK
jgi:hypothetical protein